MGCIDAVTLIVKTRIIHNQKRQGAGRIFSFGGHHIQQWLPKQPTSHASSYQELLEEEELDDWLPLDSD